MRATMNISLPSPLKSWVEEQVELRGYSTASEFVRDVLRREQQQAVRSAVDTSLVAAIESGPAAEMTSEAWERIREEAGRRARVARAAGSKKATGRRKR